MPHNLPIPTPNSKRIQCLIETKVYHQPNPPIYNPKNILATSVVFLATSSSVYRGQTSTIFLTTYDVKHGSFSHFPHGRGTFLGNKYGESVSTINLSSGTYFNTSVLNRPSLSSQIIPVNPIYNPAKRSSWRLATEGSV